MIEKKTKEGFTTYTLSDGRVFRIVQKDDIDFQVQELNILFFGLIKFWNIPSTINIVLFDSSYRFEGALNIIKEKEDEIQRNKIIKIKYPKYL